MGHPENKQERSWLLRFAQPRDGEITKNGDGGYLQPLARPNRRIGTIAFDALFALPAVIFAWHHFVLIEQQPIRGPLFLVLHDWVVRITDDDQ